MTHLVLFSHYTLSPLCLKTEPPSRQRNIMGSIPETTDNFENLGHPFDHIPWSESL